MVKFIFNLTPVSQDRTRYSTRPFPHEYDTKKVAAYKKALSAMAVKQMEEEKERIKIAAEQSEEETEDDLFDYDKAENNPLDVEDYSEFSEF